MTLSIPDIAKRYLSLGFSPIPLVPGEKRPSIREWQQYADEPMGLEEAERLFQHTDSIGLVMGFDGIQCLDIDSKHFTHGNELEEFISRLEDDAPGLVKKMVVQHTRSGGQHWIFKCNEIDGNQKLARNATGEVMFETRGKGGQIVTYPSPGYRYEGKLTKVQRISEEERDILFRTARTLDQMQATMIEQVRKKGQQESDDHTPWGEFRATHSAIDILLQHGWRIVGENSKMVYLLRPGTTENKTSGVIFKDSDIFWPWTTSTAFQAEKPYDGFQCFTTLVHGGDFNAAIADIRAQGYGKPISVEGPTDFNIETMDVEEVSDMEARLAALEVDSTIEVAAPPRAIEMVFGQKSFHFGTLGNFSLVQGKAKSRKSYFLSAVTAAAACDHLVCETLRGYIHPRKVIYIDTEQGDYHVSKAKKRIQEMAGMQTGVNYEHFKYFRFRSLDTNADRLKFVEFIFQTYSDIGFMVIDGIADVASKGVNDEEEATKIASKLLKWTADHNCHITVVLHENKNDRNAKGHLGAYLVQKAESTFSAKKSESNRDITEITPEYTRNIEPPAIEMTIGGFDTVEFSEVAVDEFYNRTRVFTVEDHKRIAEKIVGKSKGDATTFIRDTEDCRKKDAEKVLSQMEDTGVIHWEGLRPKIAALGKGDF